MDPASAYSSTATTSDNQPSHRRFEGSNSSNALGFIDLILIELPALLDTLCWIGHSTTAAVLSCYPQKSISFCGLQQDAQHEKDESNMKQTFPNLLLVSFTDLKTNQKIAFQKLFLFVQHSQPQAVD
jgi:hypothetical protein